MKLLVIVLCLLSERFLVHTTSHRRFHWFSTYANMIQQRFSRPEWLLLALTVLPPLAMMALVLYFFSSWAFGLVGLLFNIAILYYCLGPDNPFYPTKTLVANHIDNEAIGNYLAQINGQLFSVIFWYILLGPLAVLLYRLISLCKSQQAMSLQAAWLTDVLEWLPSRMTALLFLMVGNFQAGLRHFSNFFFTLPQNNQILLSSCGLQALGHSEEGVTALPQAERLVEHAVIGLLVLLACFTLFAWM